MSSWQSKLMKSRSFDQDTTEMRKTDEPSHHAVQNVCLNIKLKRNISLPRQTTEYYRSSDLRTVNKSKGEELLLKGIIRSRSPTPSPSVAPPSPSTFSFNVTTSVMNRQQSLGSRQNSTIEYNEMNQDVLKGESEVKHSRASNKLSFRSIYEMLTVTVTELTMEEVEATEDFQFGDEGDALSVKRMRENILRVSHLISFVSNNYQEIISVSQWKKPKKSILIATLLLLFINSDWWFTSLLSIITFKLTMNLYIEIIIPWWQNWSKLIPIQAYNYFDLVSRTFQKVALVTPKHERDNGATEESMASSMLSRAKSSYSNLEEKFMTAGKKSAIKKEKSFETSKHEVYGNVESNEQDQRGERQPSTKDSDRTDGFAEKITYIFQIARRVQNFIGIIADQMERIQTLLKWRDSFSKWIYLGLWITLGISFLLPSTFIFQIFFSCTIVKIGLLDGFIVRYKKIKNRLHRRLIRQPILSATPYDISNSAIPELDSPTTLFFEAFDLPVTESPIEDWRGGKRCTLVRRDRSLSSSYKSGKLFLTPSYLCFQRSRAAKEKNIKIFLKDIDSILKAESYSWIPGGGMAIEICLKNAEVNDEQKTGLSLSLSKRSFGEEEETQDEQFEGGANNPGTSSTECVSSYSIHRVEHVDKEMRLSPVRRRRKADRRAMKSYFFGGIRNRDEVYENLIESIRNLPIKSDSSYNNSVL